MIVLNVFFDVKNDKKEDFLILLKALVQDSLKEEGCERYQLTEDVLSANTFVLVEHWQSEEMLKAHHQTPHFLNFIDKISQYLQQDVLIKKYIA